MKKKVYVYEARVLEVFTRDQDGALVENKYMCTSYDTVDLAGRTWLNAVSPAKEFYIDMATVVSFSVSTVDPYGSHWIHVEEPELPLPEEDYEFVYVRLNS